MDKRTADLHAERCDYAKPVIRVDSYTIGYEVPGGILYVTTMMGQNSVSTHSVFVPSGKIINRSEI